MTRLSKQLRQQKTAIVSFSVLLAATIGGVTAKPLIAAWIVDPVLTQVLGASAFPLPTNVPVGTVIRIGGSSGMETINQVLKRRFEQQFVGTDVVLNTQGTGPAIKDVLDGNADLAAIGRSLTEQEKAQGLVPVPVSRHKIAVIVGTQNPFKGDLTFEQFAKIFRGEIKDWSQLGGARGAIRFIDRPTSSDTRQAFRNYPVFKKAPFVTGKTTKQVADSTSQVVQALGEDGIGYAIADQLEGRGDVRVLTMHKTLPSNPKYPFSQPLIYVYKGPQPNPSAQAFLGFAAAPASRKTIETARKEATALLTANPDAASPQPKVSVSTPPVAKPSATASPQATVSTPPNAAETAPGSAIPWWWLLALPLVGGLFWWLLKDREGQLEPEASLPESAAPDIPLEEAIVPVPEVVPPLLGTAHSTGRSRLILEPRSCTDAYAYWEIPTDELAALQQQGARKLVLRLYDVTGVDLHQQPPLSLQEFDCAAGAHDRDIPIRTDDRDYLAELGYIAEDGRWLQVARSESVHVPPCPVGQPPAAIDEAMPVSELPPDQGDDAVKIGGAPLADRGVAEDPLPEDDAGTRTMLAGDRAHFPPSTEATPDRWMPPNPTDAYTYSDVTAGVKNVGATSLSFFTHRTAKEDNHDRSSAANQPPSQGEIVLVPRDRQSAYIHWTVPQADKDALKHQGGQQLVLRVYDVMGAEATASYSRQEFLCNEWEHDQQVPIPVSNVDYVAELGYTTFDGRFLTLARSPATRVPGA